MKVGHDYEITTEDSFWAKAHCASVNGNEAVIHWSVEGKIKRQTINMSKARICAVQ